MTDLRTAAVFGERLLERDGNLYLIRDTVTESGRIQCQYATAKGGLSLEWCDCSEGGDFASIEPVRTVRDTSDDILNLV